MSLEANLEGKPECPIHTWNLVNPDFAQWPRIQALLRNSQDIVATGDSLLGKSFQFRGGVRRRYFESSW